MQYETHDLNFIKHDHVNFINDCQDAKERFDIFFPQTSTSIHALFVSREGA